MKRKLKIVRKNIQNNNIIMNIIIVSINKRKITNLNYQIYYQKKRN